MCRLTILVDMDGVLGDFVTSFLSAYHKAGGMGEPSRPIQWTFIDELDPIAVDEAWRDPGLWLHEHPYPGAFAGLRALHERHSVYVVTDPGPHPMIAIPAKLRWLGTHAPWFPQRRLWPISDRSKIMADILVDDRAENVREWLSGPTNNGRIAGGLSAYLPSREWNHDAPRIHGLPTGLAVVVDGELDTIARMILKDETVPV